MNKITKYFGVIALVLFSFFYTEEAIHITNDNNPTMKEIKKYEKKLNRKCSEGYREKNGVILGVSGKEVNVNKSYNNMRGIGFSEDLLVFNLERCEVNKDTSLDNYIVGGNNVKNSISFIIFTTDIKKVVNFVKIAEEKDITFSIAGTGEFLNNNKEELKKLYNMGYDLIYSGNEEKDYKKYRKILKELNSKGYCIYTGSNEIINICSPYKVNSIKTNNLIEKNLYSFVKNNLDKGMFYSIKDNNYNLNEFGITINFIKAKGINIKTISSHLSDEV